MRRLYSLLTFLVLALSTVKIQAQTTDSCRANFERIVSDNSLTTTFHAIPWHNLEKKPELICWNFGDNHDTCIQYSPSLSYNYSVSHIYAQKGSYNVCVKITYQGGCQSYACKVMPVGQPDSCRASFEALSSTSNSLGEYFIAQPWHNNNKRPVAICWSFGDNRDTCIQYSASNTGNLAVYHLYSHADNYNVCVKIQYEGGCVSDYCHAVHVGESTDSCSANFEIALISPTSLGRRFIALPWQNHNKKPVSICWNFGDKHDTCIQISNTIGDLYVDHRYAAPGEYQVCVRIAYDGGCVSEKCRTIQVGMADSCYADFEKIQPPAGNNSSSVYFRAIPKSEQDRKPVRICWSFGDGRDTCISYGVDFTGSYVVAHRYDRAGIFEVCVDINYDGGCEARKCRRVEIFLYHADTCRVRLYQVIPAVNSLMREFYVAAASGSRAVRVCWNFGDGTDTCVSVEPTATNLPYTMKHTYPAPGTYRACVKVLFENGCSADDCAEVNIRALTDICGGYFVDSLMDAHSYLFKAFSAHKPDDAVVGYRWNFGDGTSGTGEKLSHTFDKPGVYRVCLVITTEKGCETRVCNDVRIAGETQLRLQLTPNPVVDVLHAMFYSTQSGSVTIRIINANGTVIREYSRSAIMGPNTWEFGTADLLPGVYSLSVQSSSQFSSAIFFKQ